ncbi:sorting nexin-4 [Pelomyxa schiedti]|nr:sorting nexin-4 [Pelomyxa schiedti]
MAHNPAPHPTTTTSDYLDDYDGDDGRQLHNEAPPTTTTTAATTTTTSTGVSRNHPHRRYSDLLDPRTRPRYDQSSSAHGDYGILSSTSLFGGTSTTTHCTFRVHNPLNQPARYPFSSYVIYCVDSKSADGSTENTVWRRYSDFLWLHDQLCHDHPYAVVPPLPVKTISMYNIYPLSRFSEPLVIYRMRELERFLYRVASHESLSDNPKVHLFLEASYTELLAAKFPASSSLSQIGPIIMNKTVETWSALSRMVSVPHLPDTDSFFVNKIPKYDELTSAINSLIFANQSMLAQMSGLQQSLTDYSLAMSFLADAQASLSLTTSQGFQLAAGALECTACFLSEMLGTQAALMTDGMKDCTREIEEIQKANYEEVRNTPQEIHSKFVYEQAKTHRDTVQTELAEFSSTAQREIERTSTARHIQHNALLGAFIKANSEYHEKCAESWKELQHILEARQPELNITKSGTPQMPGPDPNICNNSSVSTPQPDLAQILPQPATTGVATHIDNSTIPFF